MTIGFGVRDRIATITLNRPDACNGCTVTMADEQRSALDGADVGDGVRVVVSVPSFPGVVSGMVSGMVSGLVSKDQATFLPWS